MKFLENFTRAQKYFTQVPLVTNAISAMTMTMIMRMRITLISVKVTGMAIKQSQRSDNERLKMRRFLRKLCLILRVAARSRNYLVPLNKWGPGWKSGCLAFLSRGRRRTARSTARFSQAPTEICLFQFLFCDAVLYWARPESCIFLPLFDNVSWASYYINVIAPVMKAL